MKTLNITALFIALSLCSLSQIPKGANVIKVSGVSFREVANKLLDDGYMFDKIDSNFQTIRTLPKHGFLLNARVTDSAVLLNAMYQDKTGQISEVANDKEIYSMFFPVANRFALSFNKPVEYLKQ